MAGTVSSKESDKGEGLKYECNAIFQTKLLVCVSLGSNGKVAKILYLLYFDSHRHLSTDEYSADQH